MKHRWFLSSLLWFACTVQLVCAERDPFEGFWKGNETFPKDAEGRTWRQTCEIQRTLTALAHQVEAHLKHRGYQQKQVMEQKVEGKRMLVTLWSIPQEKERELVVILLENDVSQTLLCWGIIDDKEREEETAPPSNRLRNLPSQRGRKDE